MARYHGSHIAALRMLYSVSKKNPRLQTGGISSEMKLLERYNIYASIMYVHMVSFPISPNLLEAAERNSSTISSRCLFQENRPELDVKKNDIYIRKLFPRIDVYFVRCEIEWKKYVTWPHASYKYKCFYILHVLFVVRKQVSIEYMRKETMCNNCFREFRSIWLDAKLNGRNT